MKNYLIKLLLLAILLPCGSCYTCYDVKKHCLSLECKFKITEKYQNKLIEFKGYDSNNKFSEFKDYEYWLIFEKAEIGDTLLKEKGKTDLILIKKDTTIIFPLMCGGVIVK